MRLTVLASRTLEPGLAIPILDALFKGLQKRNEILELVTGDCDGIEKAIEQWADMNQIPIKTFPADWSLGEEAGIKRNASIIKESETILAFWDGESVNTLDAIARAKKAQKTIFTYLG